MIRTLLKPFSWIYAKIAARRIENTQSLNVGIPVICVGNATMGGTGKTPVAAYLLKSLRRLKIEAHGLTRGYGGQEMWEMNRYCSRVMLQFGWPQAEMKVHAPRVVMVPL